MASSSSSSNSKYDVFVSFKEEDTRRTFVSHLYRSLDQKGIRTFKDENQQTRDGRISHEIAQAIKDSNIAVVVISENFASSVWCLDVLTEIVENSMVTKAVFYGVDPGYWRRRTGDFRRLEDRENQETVHRWMNALHLLDNTSHRFCSRNWEDDSKMLDSLISSISHAMSSSQRDFEDITRAPVLRSISLAMGVMSISPKHTSKSFSESGETELDEIEIHAHVTDNMSNELTCPNGLVGMDRHKKAIYEMLDLESKNQVRTIGIWGMEGVGKTTLAEFVFDEISQHFQHHCFLTNVDNIHRHRISPSLLEHFTRTRRSNDDSFDAIKPSLVNRNLLLVVDGVLDSEQFRDIVKLAHWLGPGSRVIMTSRDEDLLVSSGVKHNYEMECLRYEEALQLFSLFAFKKTYPLIGFERFSIRAVHFAGFLPLALKVLGSFLYGQDEKSWKSTLRRLEASQDNCIHVVSSYIGACDYLPRQQIELERFVRAEEDEYSPSYHMLL